MASMRIRVAREKRVVPLRRACGPLAAPSDWITASVPVTAAATRVLSSASPANFSSAGASSGMEAAPRAKARTRWPASRARFTVSRPMPWLAPMTRTVAMAASGRQRLLDLLGVGGQHLRLRHLAGRRGERYGFRARHDVEMQMEHHLPAGRLVELLQGDAGGAERLHGSSCHLLHRLHAGGELSRARVQHVACRRLGD